MGRKTKRAVLVVAAAALVVAGAAVWWLRPKSAEAKHGDLVALIRRGTAVQVGYGPDADGAYREFDVAAPDLSGLADWVRRSRIDPAPASQPVAGQIVVTCPGREEVVIVLSPGERLWIAHYGSQSDEKDSLDLLGPGPCAELIGSFRTAAEGRD